MLAAEHIFNEISSLKLVEKLQLIDKKLEDILAREAEDRIEAYDRGLISTVSKDEKGRHFITMSELEWGHCH